MKNITRPFNTFFILWLIFMIFSCTNNTASTKNKTSAANTTGNAKSLIKPPSAYQDTLAINSPAAVFYYPDSLQLEKIKSTLDTGVYKGIMHDYFFQMRYAHIVIKKSWPSLAITECRNYRYLLFIKKDGSRQYIDINTISDAYGLFVFDGKKPPLPVDLTNIETQVSIYLKK